VQHNKPYHIKVLFNSVQLNGHTLGFYPRLEVIYKPEDPNGHFSSAVFPNAAFPHHISSANALGHDVFITKLKTHNKK